MNEHSLFLAVLEVTAPVERAAYLDRACGDDPELRRQVASLIEAHERTGAFLDVPALRQMEASTDALIVGEETWAGRHLERIGGAASWAET